MKANRAIDGSDPIFTTIERMGPVEYCRIYMPNITVGGGLVESLYVEVTREHYEPIEDEL